ncbi:methyltransferase [Patescibacteria group bacterium]|nr:methyltransferase [Patescibacteria group bacterium]MCL5410075.1 methyltransferase [Patescibacteria group bacterium]
MQHDFYQILVSLLLIPILLVTYWRLRLKRLAKYQSSLLGRVEVWEKYNHEKMLTINNYVQGVSIQNKSIIQSYWYKIAQLALDHCQDINKKQILMLGLGANTISALIAQKNSSLQQTVVEFDPTIIRACQQFFNLQQTPNLAVVPADVYKIAKDKHYFSHKFAVIIVDVFTGKPPYVSLQSNQPNFIEQVCAWLRDDGMIIFNRPAHLESVRQDGYQLEKSLKILFKKTAVVDIIDPRGFRNFVITAQQKRRKN